MKLGAKLLVSAVVVALYAIIPVLAGLGAGPAVFTAAVGGVPLSVWVGVGLLFAFPLIAWLCSGEERA